MNTVLSVALTATPEQQARLQALQRAFAQACNALAPLVQQSRCWNRVALHHLAYRQLREQFPAMGSQMVCNAIYSVSRAARLVYQHPNSPFCVGRGGAGADVPLPRLVFLPSAPVYFDRHTLSIKPNQLSMYTLDGRMRFQLTLATEVVALFEQRRLREVLLTQRSDGQFVLGFVLAAKVEGANADVPEVADAAVLPVLAAPVGDERADVPWPSYLNVEETA
jgi:hypothetical protein